MRTTQRLPYRCTILALLLGNAALTAGAAEPCRWRLQPDRTYQLQVNWFCEQTRPGFEIGERAQAELTWKVLSVDEQGHFELAQTLTRVNHSVECPSVGTVQYDSRDAAEPKGTVADLAAYWKPWLGSECRRCLTPRGDLVPLAETATIQPKETPLLRRDFGFEPWRSVLRRGFPVFPESVLEVGQQWTQHDESTLPSQTARCLWTTRYTYQGSQTRTEGGPWERFRVDCQMEVEPAVGQPSIEIQSQSCQGTLLFDRQAGHLASSELNQDLMLTVAQPGFEPLWTRLVSSVQVQFLLVASEPAPSSEPPAE